MIVLWLLMIASILYGALILFWAFKKIKDIKWINIPVGILMLIALVALISLSDQANKAELVWEQMHYTNSTLKECVGGATTLEDATTCFAAACDDYSYEEELLYKAIVE